MRDGSMHLALVSTHPPSMGSLNEYAFHFLKYLHLKPEIGRISMLVDHLPDGQQYPNMPNVDFVPCWRFNAPSNAWQIRQQLQRLQPDAVLFNLQFASFGSGKVPATLGLLAPRIAKQMGFPTIVLLHNIMETVDLAQAGFAGNPLMERAIRFAGEQVTQQLLQADYVACTIPKYVEILREKYRVDNVLLAPHGSFEEATTMPSFDLPDGPKQIMTFGKFGTYKRVERLIEAFDVVQQRRNGHGPVELVIAGSDSPNAPDYLATMQATYQHVPNVRYTGYVAEDDVPRIFGDAAVVVFPYTATTGSSGVLHQAGDYAKAVVLPNIGDFAEVIIEEGYTGAFFDPQDADSLAQAIESIIDDPAKRKQIGAQNYVASTGIPMNNVVDWYLLHFEQLLQGAA